ncbi:hypothetical protein BU17DRAFT_80425 [Hysterangium stoloniferum]|nr:hypothetical protein BU17DRAFT_80425 [Hysterangium stoloniferum]
MLNLDHHHPTDQNTNNNILQNDWNKSHALALNAADPTVLSVQPAHNPYPQESSARAIEPVTPADAVDSIPPPSNQNLSPETPGDVLSAPNDNDSTSSLSPIPSPEGKRGLNPSDAHLESTESDPPTRPSPSSYALPVTTSRQSTPLTDLSHPNTPSRVKDDDVPADDGGALQNHDRSRIVGDNNNNSGDVAPDVSNGTRDESRQTRSVSGAAENGSDGHGKGAGQPVESAGEGIAQPPASGSSASAPTKMLSSSPTGSQQSNGMLPRSSMAMEPSLDLRSGAGPSTSQKTPPEPPDEKASTILQLNAELLKVCMECQVRQLMRSPEFEGYTTRLESNLKWLAAAADHPRHSQIPLPVMTPPPSFAWYSPDVINEYYQRLPKMFVKELARRQAESANPTPSVAGVKRGPDTADDGNVMRKRLDTGERRLSNPISSSMSAASPPHIRPASVMSNGTIASSSNLNVGLNINPEPSVPPTQGMGISGIGLGGMSLMAQQQSPHQPSTMRVSPETMAHSGSQMSHPAGMSDAQMVQMRDRARLMQGRQNPGSLPAKESQRMPPPAVPHSIQNPVAQMGGNPGMGSGPGIVNPQMAQIILNNFGQTGLQNFHALQQGPSHPFVVYMINNVQGFSQMPLQQQLQRMQIVQNNVQQARLQQQQRVAAAGGMNGITPQGLIDPSSPFNRHSGSPPNVNAAHLQQQHSGISPSTQTTALPYTGVNGMGMGMQTKMQQRPGTGTPQNMAIPAAAAMGGMNVNNMTPQQRQLLLMQQQMHQRQNDGAGNPQQAYMAAQQEKIRQEQVSRMSNQRHSPPHSAGSSPSAGSLPGHVGIGSTGMAMPGMTRAVHSPTEMTPVTPRMPQKRPAGNDTYQMALYNQAQRQASMGMRPGTAMGMNPPMTPQQQQQAQLQQTQVHGPASQLPLNGGAINPGMMYGGGGMGQSPGQNWQSPNTPQQQQQFHAISPAALQHHPDSGTPRPGSSTSSHAMGGNEGMGESFDALFDWNDS